MKNGLCLHIYLLQLEWKLLCQNIPKPKKTNVKIMARTLHVTILIPNKKLRKSQVYREVFILTSSWKGVDDLVKPYGEERNVRGLNISPCLYKYWYPSSQCLTSQHKQEVGLGQLAAQFRLYTEQARYLWREKNLGIQREQWNIEMKTVPIAII